MAGAKARSGGARPGSGGARVGAGRKPSEKTLFERNFVGPLKPKRGCHRTDAERAEARRLRELKKSARISARRELERQALGIEKYQRTTTHEGICQCCGSNFVSKISLAKYCSAICKNRAGNTSERVQEMRKSDAMYRLKNNLRALIRTSFRRRGFAKGSKTEEILGCSWPEFRAHIERQFLPGMCWEKMGLAIHIDHIIPLATADNASDVLRLNHYTNLRPLWALDNMRKGARIAHLI